MDSHRTATAALLAFIGTLWHDPAPSLTLALVILAVMISSYFTARYAVRAARCEVEIAMDIKISEIRGDSRDFLAAMYKVACHNGG